VKRREILKALDGLYNAAFMIFFEKRAIQDGAHIGDDFYTESLGKHEKRAAVWREIGAKTSIGRVVNSSDPLVKFSPIESYKDAEGKNVLAVFEDHLKKLRDLLMPDADLAREGLPLSIVNQGLIFCEKNPLDNAKREVFEYALMRSQIISASAENPQVQLRKIVAADPKIDVTASAASIREFIYLDRNYQSAFSYLGFEFNRRSEAFEMLNVAVKRYHLARAFEAVRGFNFGDSVGVGKAGNNLSYVDFKRHFMLTGIDANDVENGIRSLLEDKRYPGSEAIEHDIKAVTKCFKAAIANIKSVGALEQLKTTNPERGMAA